MEMALEVGAVRSACSTRAIKPEMPSRLRSSVAMRASSRSWSAASQRTVSASRRPSRASSERLNRRSRPISVVAA